MLVKCLHTYNSTYINRMEYIQNKATRFILNNWDKISFVSRLKQKLNI